VVGDAAPEWWGLIWPAVETPPEAWLSQRLDRHGGGSDGGWKGAIPQPKNGPCGVLAVVHGLVLAEQHTRQVEDIEVDVDSLTKVIFGILKRCLPEPGAPIRLVQPADGGNYSPTAGISVADFSSLDVAMAEIQRRGEAFQRPGGVIDLVYSAVFTRGIDLVRQEVLSEGGELPLIPKAFNCWLCSMELLSLLLRGSATGNVGAFNADGTPNTRWDGASPIGILSRKEKEQGIPMAEALKSPPHPVWILHSGDHFTLAWAQTAPSPDAGAKFKLYHWNGLPPGGPRLAEMDVLAIRGAATQVVERPKFYKPELGEIDEVVQADPEDKTAFPGEYRRWRYEVMLAWDRPDLQGEPRPADAPPAPKFDQEDPRYQRVGAWRCRCCYDRRFQTMDFSLVPADSPDACSKCQKPRKECGWSLWVPFSELPPARQATVMDQHAKKIEPILWTKWPAAEVTSADGSALPDC